MWGSDFLSLCWHRDKKKLLVPYGQQWGQKVKLIACLLELALLTVVTIQNHSPSGAVHCPTFYTVFWKQHQSLSTCNRVRETCPKLVLTDMTDKAFLILFKWTDPVPVTLRFIFYLKRETTDAVPSVNDTKCDTPSWLGVFRTMILKIHFIWNVNPLALELFFFNFSTPCI